MTKDEAIQTIQRTLETNDCFRDAAGQDLPLDEYADRFWQNGKFQLGMKWGFIWGLMVAKNLEPGDLPVTIKESSDG